MRLRAALTAHAPATATEAMSVRRVLRLLDWLPRPFDRQADPMHVTGSAIVVDDGERVLLHRHVRLLRWLQPGGHVEAGEAVEEAARRETLEETGVATRHPASGPRLLHVDVHEGPLGHVHLDVRWLLLADPGPPPASDAAWFGAAEAAGVADGSLAAALAALRAARPA